MIDVEHKDISMMSMSIGPIYAGRSNSAVVPVPPPIPSI